MAKMTQGKTNMLHKDLTLYKFENGFRLVPQSDLDDKFYVLDNVKLEIGSEYRIGPNGYFEYVGNSTQDLLDNTA